MAGLPNGMCEYVPSSCIFIATPREGSKVCLVALVWTNSMPQKRPFPRMLPTAGCPPSLFLSRRPSRAPCSRTLATSFLSLMILCTSNPALHASGCPWYVCPWLNAPLPRCSTSTTFLTKISILNGECKDGYPYWLVSIAAMGMYPPPNPFPMVIMSGTTPMSGSCQA